MSRFCWNYPKQQKSLLFVMLVLGLACGLVAQGYSPGQTFSSNQQPARTPVPQRPIYRQPVYRQATPAPAQRQQRTVPAAPASMYNMQRQQSAQESKAPTRSSAAESNRTQKSSSNSVAKSNESSDKVSDKAENSSTEKKAKSKSEVASSSKSDDSPETIKKVEADSKADDKPSAPESTDKLVFFSRKTGKKQIALTYDDGPNPTLTPKLIDWLKANNVPATFFMQGEMVKTHMDLAKQVAADGFELANHSYSHPDLRKLSEEKIIDELQDTHDLIKEATGVDVKLMRPPYGAHNSKVDAVCRKLGYKIINWDIDTNDWRNRSADAIAETIMSKASDGSIVLMHDRKHRGRESVLEATQRVVPALRAKGYTFVTVGELIGVDQPATIDAVAAAPQQNATPAEVTTATLAAPASELPVPAAATPVATQSILPQ